MEIPVQFKERMREMLGEEYDAFIKAFSEDSGYTAVRINTMKDKAGAVRKYFSLTDRVAWCENGYYTDKEIISGNHPYHCAGLIYFQEPSAMAPMEALPIEEGDRVLDLCAAPGGKTTRAAEKLSGSGILVSNEIVPPRADILAENTARLGFSNVVVTNENPSRIAAKYEGFFNKVIVDAPCSGEGMFRKEPKAAECWSIAHTRSCAERQRAIIDSAMKSLAPGGMLVYSTCTFAMEENEDIAGYILSEYPYMRLEEPPELCMLSGGIGMNAAKRIYPHLQRGEGHFIALFRDTRSCEKTVIKNCRVNIPDEFKEFSNEYLNKELSGEYIFFKDRLYLKPFGIDIDKIKTVSPGLFLGVRKKNRFEPSYHLCHALSMADIKNTENFSADDENLKKYLAGECIPCDKKGWTAVCADGFPIGWGKASGGVLKNHYPKYMRIPRK